MIDFCGSASLKFKRLQLFLGGIASWSAAAQVRPLSPPIASSIWIAGCSVPAPAKRLEQRFLAENKASLWGERSLCASANSRFCRSASLNLNTFNFFCEESRAGLWQAQVRRHWAFRRRFRSAPRGAPCPPSETTGRKISMKTKLHWRENVLYLVQQTVHSVDLQV
jgi:hypothetical protein